MDSKDFSQEELFEFQKDLLKSEIEYIHSKIETYDDLSFKIKGWAVTIWSVVVAYGAQNRDSLIILASLPALITFWILDAHFKQYQRHSRFRMGRIEKFLDSKEGDNTLRSAFKVRSFGDFPVHDPMGNRTRNSSPENEKKYLERTNYWDCFTVPNILYFFLTLILSSVIISMLINNF